MVPQGGHGMRKAFLSLPFLLESSRQIVQLAVQLGVVADLLLVLHDMTFDTHDMSEQMRLRIMVGGGRIFQETGSITVQ